MVVRPFVFPFAILAAGTVGVAALAAGAASSMPPPGPGLDLINERCGFCHSTAQVLDVRKTPANWALSVQAMIDRGAELTTEEQQVVVDYLATNRTLDDAATTTAATTGSAAEKSTETAKR